ncbi:MAG: hypothetical protein ACI9SY_000413 [Candidatus Paceibacteria bacterium]|jgi:hypothetical protein
MYKNWIAIAQETNPWLKMLLITAADEMILDKLKQSFPGHFQATKEDSTIVPISIVAAKKKDTASGAAESPWYFILDELDINIPMFEWMGNVSPGTTFVSGSLPDDWRSAIKQAVEDKSFYSLSNPEDGIIVFEWNDEECLLVDVDKEPEPDGRITSVVLIPRRFIDLDA